MMNDLHDTIANIRNTPMAGVPQTQPPYRTHTPGTSLLREVIHADAEDFLDARITSLHEALTANMSDLHGRCIAITDQLSDKVQEGLQEMKDKVEPLR